MAVSAGSLTNVATEMKEAYPTGTFKDAVNKEAKFRKMLERVDLKFTEGTAVFPLRLAAAQNIGAVDDFEAYPSTGDPTRIKAYCEPQQFVGTFSIGGKAKILAASGKSTFNDGGILADRIEGTVADLAKYINIVYAGSNRGRIAVVLSDGANTMVMDKPQGVRLIKNRFPLDVYTALTGGSVRDSLSNRRVTARATATNTITYAGANQTAVAGDSVFVAGTYGRTPYTLDDIVDDGTNADTLFGVASLRTNNPATKAQVHDGDGSLHNITEMDILTLVDQVVDESGQRVTKAISGPGIFRKVLEHVIADRRYLQSGTGAPSYTIGADENSIHVATSSGNLRWEVDRDIQPRKAYFLAMNTWGLYVAQDMDWINEDDGGMLKLVPGTDGYVHGFVAMVGSLENIFCYMPAANGVMRNLKDSLAGDV